MQFHLRSTLVYSRLSATYRYCTMRVYLRKKPVITTYRLLLHGWQVTTYSFSAKISWALRTVVKNESLSSNNDINIYFKRMFSNFSVAQTFTCGETKYMYLAVYGIASHFSDLLEKKRKYISFMLMFDESLNKVMQMK